MKREMRTIPLPYFFVGKDLASERIGNYSAKHALLSTHIGKPDTKSVWYSKEHITELIDEIELASGDGMRIFFGSYDCNHAEFADQTCLVMVVTREQLTENGIIHQNVIVEEEPGFEERSAEPAIVPNWIKNNRLYTKRDFNHGSPCPPVCDGDEGEDYP